MTLHVLRPFSLDPLVAEAKRRMRRRRVLTLVLAVVVGGGVAGATVALSRSGAPSSGIVPSGVRDVTIRSAFPVARPAAAYVVRNPAIVRGITELINALEVRRTTYTKNRGLGVAGIAPNQMCPAIGGPTATLELRRAAGSVLASASFVTNEYGSGLSAVCDPLWFGRGRSAIPGGSSPFHPQFVLAGHTPQQAHFVQQLERLIGRPLCQRDAGAPVHYCGQ